MHKLLLLLLLLLLSLLLLRLRLRLLLRAAAGSCPLQWATGCNAIRTPCYACFLKHEEMHGACPDAYSTLASLKALSG